MVASEGPCVPCTPDTSQPGLGSGIVYMLPFFIPFFPLIKGHSHSVSIVSVATELFWVQPILSMFVSEYITLKSPLLFSQVLSISC